MYKKLFFIGLCLFFAACKTTEKTAQTPPKTVFPTDWFGTWAGTLNIINAKGVAQSVPMKLVIGKTDTAGIYQWNIIYGEDEVKGLRPYLLRTIDAARGVYLCDELNSIKMESYLLGSRLFCSYFVAGNFITSIEELQPDGTMLFEIIFGKEKPVSTTGNTKNGEEDIPEVRTLPVVINQRAILKKVQ